MDPELLIRTLPRVYHMAYVDAWDGIQRHGLLSTTALLDLFEVNGEKRHAIESCRRPENVIIEHAVHGRAIIRDNKPMDDHGLRRALQGITPKEWYELLNRRVFFWLSEQRLTTLLSAKAYRGAHHCVLTVSTRSLVERHSDRIWLCPINSGTTKPMPHPRGRDAFQRIHQYPFEHWCQKRGSPHKAIVELAVDYAVPDIVQLVDRVAIHDTNGFVREVWRR